MPWKKCCDLVKAQSDHNLPSHTFIADCPTRQDLFTRWLPTSSADYKCSYLLPTCQDTEVLQVINEVLSQLADLTNLLSCENMSVSSIKPVLKHIHSDAFAEKDDDASFAKI